MTEVIGYLLYLITAGLAGLILYDAYTGKVPLLSMRNIFIVGLCIFQYSSAGLRALTGVWETDRIPIADVDGTLVIYAVQLLVFTGLFLLAYKWGPLSGFFDRKMPTPVANYSDGQFLFLALALTVLHGVIMRLPAIPGVGVVLATWALAFGTIACAMAGWVWSRKLTNPALAGYTMVLLGFNAAIAITGAFGRRTIVTVFAGLIWGVFYGGLRQLRAGSQFFRLGMLLAPAVMAVALYSSVRSAAEHDRSAADHVRAVASGGNLKEGLFLLLEGQGTAVVSMFLIEQFEGDTREPRYFFMPWYTVALNVPRAIWPDKPEPISTEVASMAMVDGVTRDKVKLSPGIIGHAAAEGGWLAIVVYAVLLGAFWKLFDHRLAVHPDNPFVVLPLCAALGQVLGQPRGDASTMTNTFLWATIGGTLAMIVIAGQLRRMNGVPVHEGDDGYGGYDDAGELPPEDDGAMEIWESTGGEVHEADPGGRR